MTKIIANDGEIIVYGDKYRVHNIEGSDEAKIRKLQFMLGDPPKLANHYPKPHTMLGAYSCLFKMYYRATPYYTVPIEIDGEIEKPPKMKPGRIY